MIGFFLILKCNWKKLGIFKAYTPTKDEEMGGQGNPFYDVLDELFQEYE